METSIFAAEDTGETVYKSAKWLCSEALHLFSHPGCLLCPHKSVFPWCLFSGLLFGIVLWNFVCRSSLCPSFGWQSFKKHILLCQQQLEISLQPIQRLCIYRSQCLMTLRVSKDALQGSGRCLFAESEIEAQLVQNGRATWPWAVCSQPLRPQWWPDLR